MPQYDGSIRINTQISTKQANIQLATLENQMVKTADKVAGLRSKMDSLKNAKIPTDEYKKLEAEAESLEKKLLSIYDKQEKLLSTGGKKESSAYQKMTFDAEKLENKLTTVEGEIYKLEKSGKNFKLGSNTEEYKKMSAQLRYLLTQQDIYNQKHENLTKKINNNTNAYKKFSNLVKGTLSRLGKQTKNVDGLKNSFKSLLKYGLGISGIIVLVKKLQSVLADGLKTFAQVDNETNQSISALKTSLTQLRNSFSSAFAPVLNIVAPILTSIVNMLAKATTYVGMFFAALSGKTTFKKAVAVQEDYAAGLRDTASAAGDAKKAIDMYLSPLDELNKLNHNTSSGGGGGAAINPSDYFEDVEIDSSISNAANKFKEIAASFFAPLKQSWDNHGLTVMTSFKEMCGSILDLAGSIGTSFMNVWTNGAAKRFFDNILLQTSNIMDSVSNLSNQFKKAWEANNLGEQIFQNIFAIINTIGERLTSITKSIKEWSAQVNFQPLLTGANNVLKALQPIIDDLGKIAQWGLDTLALPFADWVIDEALPAALEAIAGALDLIHSVAGVVGPQLQFIWDNFLKHLVGFMAEYVIVLLEGLGDFLKWLSNNPTAVTILGTLVTTLLLLKGLSGVSAIITGITAAISGLITAIAGSALGSGLTGVLSTLSTGLGTATTSFSTFLAGLSTVQFVELASAIGLVAVAIDTTFKHLPEYKEIGSFVFGGEMVENIKETKELEKQREKLLNSDEHKAYEKKQAQQWVNNWQDAYNKAEKNNDKYTMAVLQGFEDITEKFTYVGDYVSDTSEKTSDNSSKSAEKSTENISKSYAKAKGEVGSALNAMTATGASAFRNINNQANISGNQIGSAMNAAKLSGVSAFNALSSAGLVNFNLVSNYANSTKQQSSDSLNQLASVGISAFNKIATQSDTSGNKVSKAMETAKMNSINNLSGITSAFQNSFSSAWGVVRKNLTDGIDYSNLESGIGFTVKGFFNQFRSGVNNVMSSTFGTINKIIDTINRSSFGSGFKGAGISKVVNVPYIPALATGAVLPANAPFLAVLGDQKNGRNLEAPEQLIRQIVREETQSTNKQVPTQLTVIAQVQRRTLFDLVIEEGKLRQQSGRGNPFELK